MVHARERLIPPRTRVAVIMQRRAIQNRWQSEAWEAAGVLAGYTGAAGPRVIVDEKHLTQWLYPGFDIVLQRAEAQGYFHNVSADAPNVFVLWRMESGRAVPNYVTVSYDEGSRWMDGGAQVDSVAMPPAMHDWVREFVDLHHRPEQARKRMRRQSPIAPIGQGPAR